MKSEVNSSSFCLAVTMTLHIPLFQELPRACVYTRMNISSRRIHYFSSVMFFWLLCSAVLLKAQTTTMPSTQRYGSGLINIPIASVLPHMMITGTYSGFFMDLSRTIEIDVSGNETGFGPPSNISLLMLLSLWACLIVWRLVRLYSLSMSVI